jgi:hypothetical protein
MLDSNKPLHSVEKASLNPDIPHQHSTPARKKEPLAQLF